MAKELTKKDARKLATITALVLPSDQWWLQQNPLRLVSPVVQIRRSGILYRVIVYAGCPWWTRVAIVGPWAHGEFHIWWPFNPLRVLLRKRLQQVPPPKLLK